MDNPSTTERFYLDLPSFSNFRDITADRHFRRVPDDWFVVISDVKGSTKAIEEGRYKDVNTIGAASISVVQNQFKHDSPYSFGGDGATLLVPPGKIDQVTEALMRLASLSNLQFGMELRVGRITAGEVSDDNCSIEVAKHELTAGKCVAVFRGGGLAEAERRIKDDTVKYSVDSAKHDNLELEGLSCRWNPIPNTRGRIMALLVLSRVTPPAKVYQAFLSKLNEIFEGKLDEANPVQIAVMGYKSLEEIYANEKRYHTNRFSWGYLKRLLEILASTLIFKYQIPPLFFNPRRYAASMRMHADYRKFDDMLRMVIDCSEEQAKAIQDYLDEAHRTSQIFYGTHFSDTALMTCYLQDLKDGEHIHFIDGGNGGYAMAAKQLKAQMKPDNNSDADRREL
ncbi:MAG: hypothetical protein ACI9OD_003281 [Limisphaerales bacterium]|jgi:hypothetical protein